MSHYHAYESSQDKYVSPAEKIIMKKKEADYAKYTKVNEFLENIASSQEHYPAKFALMASYNSKPEQYRKENTIVDYMVQNQQDSEVKKVTELYNEAERKKVSDKEIENAMSNAIGTPDGSWKKTVEKDEFGGRGLE